MCACVFTSSLYICYYSSLERVRTLALRFEWKIEHADLTDLMSFLPTILVEKVRSIPETLSAKPFITNKNKQEIIEKNSRDKSNLCMNDKKYYQN